MNFELEVLKLIIPFLVALTAIWVKEWYVTRNERRILQRLLFKDLNTQLEMLPEIIQSFSKIPEKLKQQGFCVFISQMSEWYFPVSTRLAQLDHGNAFVYGNFSSRAKHVEASSNNLQKLLNDAISVSESKKALYLGAVEASARGLQRDFVTYSEACLYVLEAIAKEVPEIKTEVLQKAKANLARAKEI